MTITRLIDWLKLSPMILAAAVLAGCDTGGDEVAPVDETIGADSTLEGDDVIVEDYEADVVDPAPTDDYAPAPEVDAEVPVTPEPAPAEETPAPAPEETETP